MADKYAVSKDWLDNTATQIQSLTGATGGLTIEQMSEQLDVEYENVQNAFTALEAVGAKIIALSPTSSDLVEVINTINADAGSGVEGFSACTVRVVTDQLSSPEGIFTAVEDGVICTKSFEDANVTLIKEGASTYKKYYTLYNVLCGSAITVLDFDSVSKGSVTVSGGVVARYSNTNCCYIYGFQAPSTDGAMGRIALA